MKPKNHFLNKTLEIKKMSLNTFYLLCRYVLSLLLSRCVDHVCARVCDNDGEIILIEAAETVPRYAYKIRLCMHIPFEEGFSTTNYSGSPHLMRLKLDTA